MVGLVPTIHALLFLFRMQLTFAWRRAKAWIVGTSPTMTTKNGVIEPIFCAGDCSRSSTGQQWACPGHPRPRALARGAVDGSVQHASRASVDGRNKCGHD